MSNKKKCKVCKTCRKDLNTKNKSGYCKLHYHSRNMTDDIDESLKSGNNINDNNNNSNEHISDSIIEDSINIKEIIKTSMLNEKQLHEDMRKIMSEQIEHLKRELASKDKIIELLLEEMKLKSRSIDASLTTQINSSDDEKDISIGEEEPSTASTPRWHQWQQVEDVSLTSTSTTTDEDDANSHFSENPISRSHRIIVTAADDDIHSMNVKKTLTNRKPISRSYQTAVDKENIRKVNKHRRPSLVVNKYPETDNIKYPKRVPGNSTYASISKNGRKILLLTDSLCGGVKMDEFNPHLEEGIAYRKIFPGGTAQEIAHYCTKTLEEEQPDIVIINCGTNNIGHGKDNTYTIYKEIVKIVETCHNHGVNHVFVSSIPYRVGKNVEVQEVNNYLRARAILNDYTYINNMSINEHHVCGDGVHLKYGGTMILKRNFLRAVNGIRRV